MKILAFKTIRLSGWLAVVLSLLPSAGYAQNVVPAADGTGTRVQVQGNRHVIDGGQLSRDRTNLFHSFERFGLTRQQIATFQSNPQIRNILTRVVGGDASVIDGLLQVVGGNSNLFLLNPAGVIFGSHAQLDLPASFTATTANGIGFNQGWFSAVGTSDYAALVGDPNAFAFTMSQPGAIANLGSLQVGEGHDLTLLGGTVVNTGQLSAPQGNLTVASIPGSSLVRLSLAGQVLSLDIETGADSILNSLNPIAFEPAALPTLLTGGGVTNATGITVNPDGSVALTGSGINVSAGDVVVTGQAAGRNQPASIAAGNGTLTAAAGSLTLTESRIEAAGNLTLSAADTVRIRDSSQQPFEAIAGGNLILQGNQGVDIFALSHLDSDLAAGADLVLRAPQTVSGDARYTASNFRIEQLDGSPGNLFSPYDPIIRASGDVSFSSYVGASLHIIAGGSVTVSDGITITGADPANSVNENILLSDGTSLTVNGSTQPTLDIRAGVSAEAIGTPLAAVGSSIPTDLINTNNPASNATISVGNIQVLAPDGLVYLSTQYNPSSTDTGGNIAINTGIVTTPTAGGNAGSIVIDSRGRFTTGGTLAAEGAVDTTGNGRGNSRGNGGDVTVLAQNTINIAGDILASSSNGSGGNLFLNSQLGDLTIGGNVVTNGGVTTAANRFSAGNIAINAQQDVTLGSLAAIGGTGGQGGSVQVLSKEGAVQVQDIQASSTDGNGGDITVFALGNLTTQNLNASVLSNGTGGNITLNSTTGSIDTSTGALNTSSTGGRGGNINANAATNIIGGAVTADGGSATGTGGGIGNNRAGQITFVSEGGITTGTISAVGSQRGGAIALTAADNLTTGDVISTSSDGQAGTISLQSENGSVTTQQLRSQGNRRGGNITVSAQNRITTQQIDSSSNSGNGGDVTLDPDGNVEVSFINAQGNTSGRGRGNAGAGGTVQIVTQRLFRATGQFVDQNGVPASISTAAGRGGAITITHAGAARGVPFRVGNATQNGTAAALTTGSSTISPPQSYQFSFTQGDIALITGDETAVPIPQIDPNNDVPDSTVDDLGNDLGSDLGSDQGNSQGNDQGNSQGNSQGNDQGNSQGNDQGNSQGNDQGNSQGNDQGNGQGDGQGNSQGGGQANGQGDSQGNGQDDGQDDSQDDDQGDEVDSDNDPGSDSTLDAVTIDIDTSSNFDSDSYTRLEDHYTDDYVSYLDIAAEDLNPAETLVEAQQSLTRIEATTGITPALLYVGFVPSSLSPAPQDNDPLELTLVTPNGQPIRRRIVGATRSRVVAVARRLREEVTNPARVNTTSYLAASQQLYKWLIAPLEPELQSQEISNLGFIMDSGLRSMPIAALYNGHQFLIERYSVGLMPSLSLVDTRYQDIRHTQALAMGASQFTNQPPLPAVPLELENIAQTWTRNGEYFIDQDFTLANLLAQRQQHPTSIVHLATHGEFLPGDPKNSYIQFWDRQLHLDQLRQLSLNDPPVELLVLSACRTAVGDANTELGFAGLAVQAGVKSALASLWYVSDAGTLALMAEFYQQLRTAPIKAEALRRAQVAMLRGDIQLQSGKLTSRGEEIELPPSLADTPTTSLRHPYYWSAFTLIGSPW